MRKCSFWAAKQANLYLLHYSSSWTGSCVYKFLGSFVLWAYFWEISYVQFPAYAAFGDSKIDFRWQFWVKFELQDSLAKIVHQQEWKIWLTDKLGRPTELNFLHLKPSKMCSPKMGFNRPNYGHWKFVCLIPIICVYEFHFLLLGCWNKYLGTFRALGEPYTCLLQCHLNCWTSLWLNQ